MPDKESLKIVLCWHMHQPDYRDLTSGVFQQPWTYLHTIKDYADMAAHMEANPASRAVFNFSPILLDQIDDYANQTKDYLRHRSEIRDPLLASLVDDKFTTHPERRFEIIHSCQRANENHIICRYPTFRRLVTIARNLSKSPKAIHFLDDQYFVDLVVWYHLGWLAEHTRRSDPCIKRLLSKEHEFNDSDRHELFQVITDQLGSIISRYRALADSGQIELSITPYAHPIIPLLLDFETTHQAMPKAPLPKQGFYAGGEARARWHIEKSLNSFKRHFGFVPKGCWPAEGGVCDATLRLLQEYGFEWTASGGGVFWHSVNKLSPSVRQSRHYRAHQPNRIKGQQITCFFRDDGLSDSIGFEFSDWHADDAIANLVERLERIAEDYQDHSSTVVAIILDGENAWEHYPENGYHFLTALYDTLASEPSFRLMTFSEYLKEKPTEIQELPNLVAGSWVYGTFSTWIGSEDKNTAWDMLCEAKHHFDEGVHSGILSPDTVTKIENQLAICEGSDWFWWFGDYNAEESVNDFDKLFRHNLVTLYKLLNTPPPDYLMKAFTFGKRSPNAGGAMRPSKETR